MSMSPGVHCATHPLNASDNACEHACDNTSTINAMNFSMPEYLLTVPKALLAFDFTQGDFFRTTLVARAKIRRHQKA